MAYAEVIGDPIAHSKSPVIHRFWLEKLGIRGDYRTAHVREAELGSFFADRSRERDWRGCNVTVPHKQSVITHLARLDPLAAEVGAVNLIVPEPAGLTGYNSDVAGIVEPIRARISGNLGRACLIGSGGAARAALAALKQAGAGDVSLVVRNPSKAEALLEEFAIQGKVIAIADAGQIAGADLLVNASVLGMKGQAAMPEELLRAVARLARDAIVFDMVYSPLETTLLATAKSAGRTTIDGLEMLIGQASAAFDRFFGKAPPRSEDAELRALLTS